MRYYDLLPLSVPYFSWSSLTRARFAENVKRPFENVQARDVKLPTENLAEIA